MKNLNYFNLVKNFHPHKPNFNLCYTLEIYTNLHHIKQFDYKDFELQENKLNYLSTYLKQYKPFSIQIISKNSLRLDIDIYDYMNSFQIWKDNRIIVNIIKNCGTSFLCVFDINKGSNNLIKFDIVYKYDDYWSKYGLNFIVLENGNIVTNLGDAFKISNNSIEKINQFGKNEYYYSYDIIKLTKNRISNLISLIMMNYFLFMIQKHL